VPVKKNSKTAYGNKALRTIAVECSFAMDRQNNRISAHRKRILKRQGKAKARIASSHLILTIAYHVLKTGEPYQELGHDYVHQKDKEKDLRMIQHLKKKGYLVQHSDQQTA
jgi:transposase